MHSFKYIESEIFYHILGHKDDAPTDAPVIIWAHGWGQTHRAFMGLAQSLLGIGEHVLVDLSGFGASPAPVSDTPWGSFEYAESMAALINDRYADRRVIWIGHSFGCRVGVQLAANHPDMLARMILIAGAGLPRKRSVYFKARVKLFKLLKHMPLIDKDKLRKRFGSADYLSAGAMRDTFMSVIREDLSVQAAQITCPVQLIYGEKDTETPPEIGHRYAKLIKGSTMLELVGQDHYTVLNEGRHQVAPLIKNFITQDSAKNSPNHD